MIVVEQVLIALFFPAFGALLLQLCRSTRIQLIDAAVCGFAATLLIGAVFYDAGAFEFYVASMVCGLLVLVLLSAWRERRVPDLVVPARSALWVGAVLALVALIGRLPVSNFIFAIGDAGAYVNSANHLAAAGTSIQQFFPLNQILLGIYASIGGPVLTPYGVLFVSLGSVWLAVKLGQTYFKRSGAGWLMGSLVALNALAMWFGRLPFSESLMLLINLGSLYYWKRAADEGCSARLPYVLFGLLVALGCLDRVTGIIWMLILSANLVFLCARRSVWVRPFLLAFAIAALGYLLSIQIAMTWGPAYYFMQVSQYLPFIHNVRGVIAFHVAWGAVLGVASAIAYWLQPRVHIPRRLVALTPVWTFAGFVGCLFVATIVFAPDWHHWLVIDAFRSALSGKLPQDSYYLVTYFTAFAIPLFFIGWYYLFRSCDPFKAEEWGVFWLFSILFMALSYIRPTYAMSHDVYMYWDRYFLSDTFVVFTMVIAAGAGYLYKFKFTRWFAYVFALAYLAQAATWMALNHDNRYLDNGYRMVAWLASSLPVHDSAVFLDNQYHAGWVFPNLRRTLLVPLAHSYGHQVYGVGIQTGPFTHSAFTPDAPLNRAQIDRALNSGKQAYIVSASAFGQSHEPLGGSMPMTLVEQRAFLVTAKPSLQGKLFAGGKTTYPISLKIYHLQSRMITVALTAHSGFYPDEVWTNGDGLLYGLDFCLRGDLHKGVINTHGYMPESAGPATIELAVDVNDELVTGHWVNRTRYEFVLPPDTTCVNSIRLRSKTFVPKTLGINDDTRHLGVDVKSIVLEP